MKPFLTLLIVLFSFIVSAQRVEFTQEERDWIQNNPTINYAFSPEWKPFEIVKEGEYQGISKDFLDLISKKTGLTFNGINKGSWENCTKAFKEKEVRLIPCLIKTKEREGYMAFTLAYAQSPVVIITQMEHPYVQGLDFLEGCKISMSKGYSNTEFIEKNYPNIEIVYFNNTKEAIEAVSAGEVEATIENLPIASYYIYYEGYSNLKIAAPVSDLRSEKIHLATQQEDSVFLGILNKAIADIYPKDKNAIFSKWISVKYDQTGEIRKVILISVIIFVFLLTFVIIFALINRKLKDEVRLRKLSESQLEIAIENISKKNDEKKLLLKEVHHRVKNNLQIINSLLRLQSTEVEDEKTLSLFKDAQNRVVTMALLHEKLYENISQDSIDAKEHFELLGKELINSFTRNQKVKYLSGVISEQFNSKALVTIGLILNEFITNSMKYAFEGVVDPTIFFGIKRVSNDYLEITYTDNGVGIEKGILEKQNSSLGLMLIVTLTEQLEGEIQQLDIEGTGFKITFSSKEIT